MLALVGLLAGGGARSWSRFRQRRAVREAVESVLTVVGGARAAALADGRARALVPEPGSMELYVRIFTDGDGDGVEATDIERGVDSPAGDAWRLAGGVRAGLPPGRRTPDGRIPAAAGLIAGRAGGLTLSPDGSTSSGSLWFANAAGDAGGVRLFGATGRVSGWFAPRGGGWRRVR